MKLVTFNTQWCCGNDGVVSPERIVNAARELSGDGGFDVLCLQEVAVNYPGLKGDASHDQYALLQKILPGYELFFGAAVDEWNAPMGRQRFGNLIATRLPVVQAQHHPLPYPADGGTLSMPRMCTVVTVRDPSLGYVRVMTTHLEFYSKVQRTAQAHALVALNLQYIAQALAPPELCDDGSPFQTKVHTAQAVLCGDFNLEANEPEYALLTAAPEDVIQWGQLWDSWRLLNGEVPQPHTFRLYDRRYGPVPICCDFVFVSDALKYKVRSMAIDDVTQVSDHQPVLIELG